MDCEDVATVGGNEDDRVTFSDVCDNRGSEVKDENYNGAGRDDTCDVHSAVLLLVQTDNNPIIIVSGDNNDNDDSSNDDYMLTSPHMVKNMSESYVPQYLSNEEGKKVASFVPRSNHNRETLGRKYW